MKNKRVTINPFNNDDKCFQYAATVALNQEIIGTHPERILKVKPFINEYNWKIINNPSGKDN